MQRHCGKEAECSSVASFSHGSPGCKCAGHHLGNLLRQAGWAQLRPPMWSPACSAVRPGQGPAEWGLAHPPTIKCPVNMSHFVSSLSRQHSCPLYGPTQRACGLPPPKGPETIHQFSLRPKGTGSTSGLSAKEEAGRMCSPRHGR